ncbi:MAG: thioredoxin family protein [Rickettsiales bacterium]
MIFFRFFILSVLLFCYQNSYSEIKRIAENHNYSAEFFVSQIAPQSTKIKGVIKITPKTGRSLLFFDQENNVIPRISWRNLQNVSIFNSTPKIIESKKDLYLPFSAQLSNNKNYGRLDIRVNFSVCKTNCYPEEFKFRAQLPNNYDSKTLSFVESLEGGVNLKRLTQFVLLALLGGLILNLMPCVLPVISLKILSVVKNTDKSVKLIRRNLLATSLGVIITFVCLGCFVIFLKAVGSYAGLGIHFQNPYFVIAIILILVFLASFVAQDISFRVPQWLANIFIVKGNDYTVVGSFFNGALATIIATPCAAPYVGTVVAFAISAGSWEVLAIFISLGIGMSLPYLMLSISKKTQSFIPKPGPWMHKFKRIMQVLLYLTVVWLLFIVSGLLGMSAAIILFLLCLLFKFSISKATSKLNYYIRLSVAIVLIALSFYLPYQKMLNNLQREEDIDQAWQKFSFSKLDKAIDSGRIVFVDITADWCVTCKYNKFVVLNNEYVLNFIKKYKVISLRGDYTRGNKEINKFLSMHNRYAIPLNIIYSRKYPHGIILPPILTTGEVVKAIIKAK